MFWDSSALVPLLIPESRSAEMAALQDEEHELAIWWSCQVECQSAVYRRYRKAQFPPAILDQALKRLEELIEDADIIPPADPLRRRAGRLLALHPLSAADALQLAAALVWCDEQPSRVSFVCLDDRLREAAMREGFTVLPRS